MDAHCWLQTIEPDDLSQADELANSGGAKVDLFLPSGPVSFSDYAQNVFPVLAKRHRYFVRDRMIVEIAYNKAMKDKQRHDVFQLLDSHALRSRLEEDFNLWVWREVHNEYLEERGRCTNDPAKVLLKTTAAFEYLPAVSFLSAQPVYTAVDGHLQILYRGYHDVHGFDNFRGRLNSQLLETCLRGTGTAPARIPHRGEVQVSTAHINWQLSSNGLEATGDFVNRAVITRISKRPVEYTFARYKEGDVLAHVKANQSKYLGAVFRIIKEWFDSGCERSDENRHDFTEWSQPLDWIVQGIFGLAPLLDGHVEELLRVSDPTLSWLRRVAIDIEREGRLDKNYRPATSLMFVRRTDCLFRTRV